MLGSEGGMRQSGFGGGMNDSGMKGSGLKKQQSVFSMMGQIQAETFDAGMDAPEQETKLQIVFV